MLTGVQWAYLSGGLCILAAITGIVLWVAYESRRDAWYDACMTVAESAALYNNRVYPEGEYRLRPYRGAIAQVIAIAEHYAGNYKAPPSGRNRLLEPLPPRPDHVAGTYIGPNEGDMW